MVPAFGFPPGIAADAVVTLAHVFDNVQRFLRHPFVEHAGGDLVFHAGPDLLGIGKGKGGFASLGPGAKHRGALVAAGKQALKAQVATTAVQHIVAPHGPQRALQALLGQQAAKSRQMGQGLPKKLIRQAARAELIGMPVRHDAPLHIEFAVIQLRVHGQAGPVGPGPIARSRVLPAQRFGHAAHGAQRGDVENGRERIRAVKLNVIGIVLPAGNQARFLRIPMARHIVHGPYRAVPQPGQKIQVPAQAVFAPEPHKGAQLPIHGGRHVVRLLAEYGIGAKAHLAVRFHLAQELVAPRAALQLREQKRRGLRVIPHMGTGARTAALLRVTSLPAQKTPVFQAETGIAAQNCQVRGQGVHQGLRQSGSIERVRKPERHSGQTLPMAHEIARHIPRVRKKRCIMIAHRASGLRDCPALGPVGHIPGEHKAGRGVLARREPEALQDAAHRMPARAKQGTLLLLNHGRRDVSGNEVAPECADSVRPAAAVP